MTSQEKATLVLKTSDLTYNSSSNIGTANSTGTVCTWNNINLRVLLGNLYDKYERFNLCLNTFTANSSGVLEADSGTYITLAGLPFVNNSYVVKSNSISQEAFLGSVLWKSQNVSTTTTPFIGSISASTLTITPYGYGGIISCVGNTGGVSSTTLTITSGGPIPVGYIVSGYGISGYVMITAQTGLNTYTMSSSQTIANTTPLSAILQNNVSLPVGSVISGNGISSGTAITAQNGVYVYALANNTQTMNTMPLTATFSSPATVYTTDVKYYGNSILTFAKNQDVCNLTITIRKTSNDALPTSTLPNMIFIFDIVGCDEYKVQDITQARILK